MSRTHIQNIEPEHTTQFLKSFIDKANSPREKGPRPDERNSAPVWYFDVPIVTSISARVLGNDESRENDGGKNGRIYCRR